MLPYIQTEETKNHGVTFSNSLKIEQKTEMIWMVSQETYKVSVHKLEYYAAMKNNEKYLNIKI